MLRSFPGGTRGGVHPEPLLSRYANLVEAGDDKVAELPADLEPELAVPVLSCHEAGHGCNA